MSVKLRVFVAILVVLAPAWKAAAVKLHDASLTKKINDDVPVDSRFFNLGGILNNLFPNFNPGPQGGNQLNQFQPGISSQNPQYPGNNWQPGHPQNLYPDSQYPGGNQKPNQRPDLTPDDLYYLQHRPGNFPGQGGLNNGDQYNRPDNTYNRPGNQYNRPDNQYNKPDDQYNRPEDQYNRPDNQYNKPDDQYNRPEGQYNRPDNQYNKPDDQYNRPEDQFNRPDQQNGGTLDDIVPPSSKYPQNGQADFGSQFPENNEADTQQVDQKSTVSPDELANIFGISFTPTTTPAGQIVFSTTTEDPSQRQCVQDCQSTSEYSPVCGSNNVTYFNAGKFMCARNCGINVFVTRKGRCTQTSHPFIHRSDDY